MNNLISRAFKFCNIKSLIHVGGHKGQEVSYYNSLNLEKIIYFEPIKEFADEIKLKTKNLKNFIVHDCALGNKDSKKLIYIADRGENDDSGSTSLLEPRESKITFSENRLIEVKKYTSFDYSDIDLAVLDTQGYELEVLKGFEEKIKTFKCLIVEFSNYEGYQRQVLFKDLNKFLNYSQFSFISQKKKVLSVIPRNKSGSYGDALYVNNSLLNKKLILKSKFKYYLLNNLITDFLIKYKNFTTFKVFLKKLFDLYDRD